MSSPKEDLYKLCQAQLSHWRGYHDHKERLFFSATVLYCTLALGVAAYILAPSQTWAEIGFALVYFLVSTLVYVRYGLLQKEYKKVAAAYVDSYLRALERLPGAKVRQQDLVLQSADQVLEDMELGSNLSSRVIVARKFPAFVIEHLTSQLEDSRDANRRMDSVLLLVGFSVLSVIFAMLFAKDLSVAKLASGFIKQARP